MTRPGPPRAESVAAAGLFVVCFAAIHTWFWGHGQLVDWPGYRDHAERILHGLLPYRDFPVEYPPGALPVFLLPAAFHDYAAAFAVLTGLLGLALTLLTSELDRRAAFYVALAPVLVGSLFLSRFDLWPSLLLTAALLALLSDRDGLAWAFLGAAVAAKLWPLVIAPLFLVRTLRRGRASAVLAGLAVAAAAFVPFAALAPHGLWASLHGQASRPLQIESLGASALTSFGAPRVVTSHGSQNVAGHGSLGTFFAAAQAATMVALWVAFARGPADRGRLLRYAAACVCAFVVLGKVLSPQYLLWLVPLVPLVRGRRGLVAVALLTAACVLTQVWFPLRYWPYATSFHLAGVVLARNVVLLALLAVLALPVRRPRPG